MINRYEVNTAFQCLNVEHLFSYDHAFLQSFSVHIEKFKRMGHVIRELNRYEIERGIRGDEEVSSFTFVNT